MTGDLTLIWKKSNSNCKPGTYQWSGYSKIVIAVVDIEPASKVFHRLPYALRNFVYHLTPAVSKGKAKRTATEYIFRLSKAHLSKENDQGNVLLL